ncbi:MAG: hypothetical protein ACREUI_00315 [Burkholderiales bacterium]
MEILLTIVSNVVTILGIVTAIALAIPATRQWFMRIFLPDPVSMEDTMPVSNKLVITEPVEGAVFKTRLGGNTRLITVAGNLQPSEIRDGRKLIVVIRTDKDYPQSMFEPPSNGMWHVPRNRLGGVDHRVFAVLLDYDDEPIFRSATVSVRLIRTMKGDR